MYKVAFADNGNSCVSISSQKAGCCVAPTSVHLRVDTTPKLFLPQAARCKFNSLTSHRVVEKEKERRVAVTTLPCHHQSQATPQLHFPQIWPSRIVGARRRPR